MHTELHDFLARLIGAVALALVPVILTAFLTLPMSLNRHPGEAPAVPAAQPMHLT